MLIDKDFKEIQERYLNGKFAKEDFINLLAECKRLKEALMITNGKLAKTKRENEFLKSNLKIPAGDLS